MEGAMRRTFFTLTLLGAAIAFAQPDKAPLPPIQPVVPGEQQPSAPGGRKAPALPQLTLSPPVEDVAKIEYASNGFIEAAHALVLIPDASTTPTFMLNKAQKIVRETFAARASLDFVDISIYTKGQYGGFGGPLPRFTASVSKKRLPDFLRLSLTNLKSFRHLWINPQDAFYGPPAPEPTDELEQNPQFEGTAAQLKAQQLEQNAAALQGGVVGNRFYHGNPDRKLAALTFDDAPHPLYAPLLLDSLHRAGVRATFFIIGRNAEAYPYFVQDMLREGHEIANHTYHHVRLNSADEATVRSEITQTNEILEAISKKPVQFFRPPGGRFSPTVLKVVRELGMTLAFWTDDPGDFNNLGDKPLEAKLLSRLRSGGIVLLHDNVLQTIQILPTFLRLAQQEGIALGTTSDLLRGKLTGHASSFPDSPTVARP